MYSLVVQVLQSHTVKSAANKLDRDQEAVAEVFLLDQLHFAAVHPHRAHASLYKASSDKWRF